MKWSMAICLMLVMVVLGYAKGSIESLDIDVKKYTSCALCTPANPPEYVFVSTNVVIIMGGEKIWPPIPSFNIGYSTGIEGKTYTIDDLKNMGIQNLPIPD
jgi:hypothetical protein